MKAKLIAVGIICLVVMVFIGCVPEKNPKVGIPVGERILDVSGMWIGQDCYMTLIQKGDKIEGTTKTRYTKKVRQYKGIIEGNHVTLDSIVGNSSYNLTVQKKRMNGTYNDTNITDKPVSFKR
jgi:hypothetical protein